MGLVRDYSLSLTLRLLTSAELYTNAKFYVELFEQISKSQAAASFVTPNSLFKVVLPFISGDVITKSPESILQAFSYDVILNCTFAGLVL